MSHQDRGDLVVADLSVQYRTKYGTVEAVRSVDLAVHRGEILGIVGESGSGKSVTCRTILGLTRREGADIVSGSILLDGVELTRLSEAEMERRIRGTKITMVFQDSARSLDPLFSVGDQLVETVVGKRGLSTRDAKRVACDLLRSVAIADPEMRLKA